MTVASVPPVVEIGYNETVNIELGMLSPDTNDFQVWERANTLFAARFLRFEVLEYPTQISPEYWNIYFEPTSVKVDIGVTLKTNVSITLTSPPISKNAIQSGIMKFRLYDTIAYGNLWTPPKGSPLDKFPNRGMWFINAAFLMRFGKYSGSVDTTYKDIDVLVKVKPYHAINFEPTPLYRLKPDQITSIPLTIENFGNYNDTFNFEAKSNNSDLKITNPPSITLSPGERKNIYLSVSVPQSAFDYGTLHKIDIKTYSVYEPDTILNKKTVYIETRGVYISETSGIGLIFLVVVIFLGIAFYMNRHRQFTEKICKKPEKPWNIQEEKNYLDQLQKKDKNEYIKTLDMMKEEYDSSMLWYKHYCKSLTEARYIKPVKKKTKKKSFNIRLNKIIDIVKSKEKPEKETKTEKQEKKLIKKKEKEKVQKKEVEIEPKVPQKSEREILMERKRLAEQRRKEIILSRVKRQESKQKKKIQGGTT